MTTTTSSDGVVTAVTDPANGSVLLRAVKAGEVEATVCRTDVLTGVRSVVRSGAPCVLIGGTGFAYDHEVSPGRDVVYTAVIAGVESAGAAVRVDWAGSVSGWLKSAHAPSVSRAVHVESPPALVRSSRSTILDVPRALPWTSWSPPSGRSWGLSLIATSEAEADAHTALLASGALLWQPNPLLSSRSWWALPGGTSEQQYGSVLGAWLTSVELIEADRPALMMDEPLRMPRWSWQEATGGMTTAQALVAYPTTWDMLLAGIGR